MVSILPNFFRKTDISARARGRSRSSQKAYEAVHPETKHGGAKGAGRGKAKSPKVAKFASFGDDTAIKTGKSK